MMFKKKPGIFSQINFSFHDLVITSFFLTVNFLRKLPGSICHALFCPARCCAIMPVTIYVRGISGRWCLKKKPGIFSQINFFFHDLVVTIFFVSIFLWKLTGSICHALLCPARCCAIMPVTTYVRGISGRWCFFFKSWDYFPRLIFFFFN